MQVRNIRPSLDPVEIAGTGQIVARDGVVTVDDDFGCLLCEQTENWAPADLESVDTFVRFCQWVAAVRAAEAAAAGDPGMTLAEALERAAAPYEPLPELTNPALAALAALDALAALAALDVAPADQAPATTARRRAAQSTTTEPAEAGVPEGN